MKMLNWFKRGGSAPVARERLQILLAYERSVRSPSDLLTTLREEILAVVRRHVTVDLDKINMRMDRGDKVSSIEIEIEIPNQPSVLAPAGA